MPHLSPMNWLLVPIFMIFTLLSLSTILWWQFTPNFPPFPPSLNYAFKVWKWW